MVNETNTRHVLGLSGGKDSAALAIYMRDRVPEMEYFFADTGAELQETYDFLEKMEGYLNKEIIRLSPRKNFDHFLKLYGNFLPSPRARWCTKEMKIKPFERWIGNDQAISYVGIRADENRGGYISTKTNISARFPFKEDGLNEKDIIRILEESGVGIPEYYNWRSRSGCYFCFFQKKSEWAGLKKKHPDLFEKAKEYEKVNSRTGKQFTWTQNESLEDLEKRVDSILEKKDGSLASNINIKSWQMLLNDEEDDDEEDSCLICHL